jgi:hypothetical protein
MKLTGWISDIPEKGQSVKDWAKNRDAPFKG